MSHHKILTSKKARKLVEVTPAVYKPISPKDKVELVPEGIKGKVDLDHKPHLVAIDPYFLMDIGLAMRFGRKKHGAYNYRKMNLDAVPEVFDAAFRHFTALLAGETHAGDSEISHIGHLGANLSFISRLAEKYGWEAVMKSLQGEDYVK